MCKCSGTLTEAGDTLTQHADDFLVQLEKPVVGPDHIDGHNSPQPGFWQQHPDERGTLDEGMPRMDISLLTNRLDVLQQVRQVLPLRWIRLLGVDPSQEPI